jgi:putative transposase
LILPSHPRLSIVRQCDLLGLPRSSRYYEPAPEDEEALRLKRLLDEQYTKRPFYGVRRMTEWLTRDMKELVNHKRVGRLMREMGLVAIYPKPKLSVGVAEHRIYPYLLRGVTVDRLNQVWATDITYIRLAQGFIYLVAVMDWFSRYVLSWELSVTMDVGFCMDALEAALRRGTPGIFNTDQGSQFTSDEFTGRVLSSGAKVSMDGRGRVFDNIFVERLWRSVKYEEVFLHDYTGVPEAREGLGRYFQFYNEERRHASLGHETPADVYHGLVRLAA